jgi:putative membrane protein
MAKRALGIAVMLLLVGLVSAPVGAAATPTQTEQSSGGHKLSWQDRRFMRQAAQAGLFEVSKSELALTRSDNRHVRQFAAQMIRDHTKANRQLKRLAAGKGVRLPHRPNAEQRRIIRRLSGLSGRHFDCAYRAVQVRAHLQTIAIFLREVRHGRDTAVTAYAAMTLPVLRMHLRMARHTRHQLDCC